MLDVPEPTRPESTIVTDLGRLRVEHVGSLIRPHRLRRAIVRHHVGETTTAALHLAEDEAVRQVVLRQELLGFPVVGDGELRRTSFADSLAGVRTSVLSDGRQSLSLERNRPLEELRSVQVLSRRPVKVTLLSVDRALRLSGSRPFATSQDDGLVEAVVAMQRRIVGELASAGCRYVQIDSPGYAAYTDPEAIARLRGRGRDPLELLKRAAAADSAVVAGFDRLMFSMHLCHRERTLDRRGELAYDGAAEVLFQSLPHHRFLLECTSTRVRFEALRFVPRDRMVVLGLVSTTNKLLEREDDVLRRIDEAARFVPVDQLGISPGCGFAPVGDQRSCSETLQWQKLELTMRVADRVWGAPAAGGEASVEEAE